MARPSFRGRWSVILLALGLAGCGAGPTIQAGGTAAHRASRHAPPVSARAPVQGPTSPQADFGGPVAAPTTGIYLGAFDNAEGLNGTSRGGMGPYVQLQSLEAQIHRTLAIDLHYSDWTTDLASPSVVADLSAGRVPLISWQCGAPDAAVAAGDDDALIASQAEAIAELHRPVMIRWFWEMEYTGSNGGKQGANAASCIGSAGAAGYVAAWRHIVDVFRAHGATNVSWVFCPGQSAYGPDAAARGVAASSYYPGDTYVDWIGEDAYSRSDPSTLPDLVAGMYDTYGDAGKPLIVCETGAEAADQPAFLSSATRLPAQYPNLRAIVYFDSHGPLGSYVFTPSGLEAFSSLAKTAGFTAMPPTG
jgi:hypothetical protein